MDEYNLERKGFKGSWERARVVEPVYKYFMQEGQAIVDKIKEGL